MSNWYQIRSDKPGKQRSQQERATSTSGPGWNFDGDLPLLGHQRQLALDRSRTTTTSDQAST
jgi:hypothetical protein